MGAHKSKVRLRVLLTLLATTILSPVFGLYFSSSLLCRTSQQPHGDVMVVLGGEMIHRPSRAAELFANGVAPRVLVSGFGDCDEVKRELEGRGVPSAAIETECESKNTSQNARFCIKRLREQGARRVVIVTSWFHSRRALNCFQHYAHDIEFVSAPTVADLPSRHWPAKYERSWVMIEYFKLVYYFFRYGVSPF